MYFASYIILGGEIILRAVRNIRRGQVFDENFLMSVATIGAFLIGEYPEGVAVMLFYQIGEFFQNFAVRKSRKSIADLMDIRPDYANVKRGGEVIKTYPDEVNVGDIIIIKVGEKKVLVGNDKLMKKMKIPHFEGTAQGTLVHVAIDGGYAGYIVIADEIKDDAARAIQDLKNAGIKQTVMLTGDVNNVRKAVAEELGLDKVYTELLPANKVQKVEELFRNKSAKGKLVFSWL